MKYFVQIVAVSVIICIAGCSGAFDRDYNGDGGNQAARLADLDYVFDLDALPVVTLTISSNEYTTLITNFQYNSGNEHYVRAQFAFEKNGHVDHFDGDVGFRVRGNTSRRLPHAGGSHFDPQATRQNAHFRVSFNTYVESGRFYRLRNLILKWHNQDPAYAREILSFDLFNRFGINAPRASYARVYLRVEDETGAEIDTYAYGVYVMMEPVDRSFLLTRFQENLGHLWKCLWGADFNDNYSGKIGMEYKLGDSSENRSYPYDFKTHSEERGVLFGHAAPRLEDFITQVNTLHGQSFEDWISANLDVEHLLKAYALNVLIGMWDGYWINNNNYYMYLINRPNLYSPQKTGAGTWL